MRSWKKVAAAVLLVPFILLALWLWRLDRGLDVQLDARPDEALRVAILDPLGAGLGRDDLRDLQRDYAPLGPWLAEALHRQVELRYGRHLREAFGPQDSPDLIVGTDAVVRAEAGQASSSLRPIARLTDERGGTDLCGLFLVRADDRARGLGDLGEHRLLFGPVGEEERRVQALAALSRCGITPIPPLQEAPTSRAALEKLAQREADAAVISSYALPLAGGEGPGASGGFRVIGQTSPQPSITVFATSRMGPSAEKTVAAALWSLREHPQWLKALRSKAGFVPWEKEERPVVEQDAPASPSAAPWTDWRGPGRDGQNPAVPERLPAALKLLWRRGLTGPGLAGIAATATHVIVADKSEPKDQDIWRCLDADTGRERWTISYATPAQMEFTNAPRATPVIHGRFVYLLSAFGDLHCVGLHGSGILWRRNILKDFGAALPTWGSCSTPLIVGDSLIVNPGAPDASLAALGLYTGEVIWKTPGAAAGYGSLIVGTFGGIRQIVGHDAESLGGWDPNTGRRLWTLVPQKKGDYHVPTPVNVSGRLLVATENNGTRLLDFDRHGRVRPAPLAQTRALAPDTSTPVVVDGLVLGCARGLFCLDLNDSLQTLYAAEQEGAFKEYAALIAGSGRVLAVTLGGELILFRAARDRFSPVDRLRVFKDTEVWSHPALVGNRLYLRSMSEIVCVLLRDTP